MLAPLCVGLGRNGGDAVTNDGRSLALSRAYQVGCPLTRISQNTTVALPSIVTTSLRGANLGEGLQWICFVLSNKSKDTICWPRYVICYRW